MARTQEQWERNNVFRSMIADMIFRDDIIDKLFYDYKEYCNHYKKEFTYDDVFEKIYNYFLEMEFAIEDYLNEKFEEN